jgi:peroxiredoxin
MTAPDFTLKNVDTGGRESLSLHQGKPVVILFWATWCTYCGSEMPSVQKIYDTYKDQGLIVMAVDVGESTSKARNYRNSHSLTFSVLSDSGSDVARKYGVTGYPTHYFINANGRISSVVVGMLQYINLDINVKSILNLNY